MPIIVEVVDRGATQSTFDKVFQYFEEVDRQFSPFRKDSEVTRTNRGEVLAKDYSLQMQDVLAVAEITKQQTNGYFDVWHNGRFDPSGVVKGWAIAKASQFLEKDGFTNFYINAGGDIQTRGKNSEKSAWKVGIKNPFHPEEIVKVIRLSGKAIATSGTYIRGEHIYNPVTNNFQVEVVSMSVIGPNILDADRFATAAFAMGRKGIDFIENLSGFEGYMIDRDHQATPTSHFRDHLDVRRTS